MRTRGVLVATAVVAVAGVLGGADAARAEPADAIQKCVLYAQRWEFLKDSVFDGSGFVLAGDAARAAAGGRERVPVAELPSNRLIIGVGHEPHGIGAPQLMIEVAGALGTTSVTGVSCLAPSGTEGAIG